MHADYISGFFLILQVKRCEVQNLAEHIASADVLVPLMSRLDKQMLQLATRAKLIIQYGVGLEAVDIPAVTMSTLPLGPLKSNSIGLY